MQHFSVFVIKFCVLQVEVDDDTGADIASGVSNKSHDAVNCGLPAVRQVSNFMFDGFETRDILDAFVYFVSCQYVCLQNQETASNTYELYDKHW